MKEIKSIPQYSSKFLFNNQATMVSYITKRNTNVILLSTYHHDKSLSDTVKSKPNIIIDYNNYKSGVDILDMLLLANSHIRQPEDGLASYSMI